MARILWFHPRQLLPPRGGGDHRTLGLIDGALAAGHEVLLMSPEDKPPTSRPPEGLRVLHLERRVGVSRAITKVVSRDPLRSARVTRRSLSAARRTIADFDPDISIVAEVMSWGLAKRLLPPKPWIYDAHNIESELFLGHLETAVGALDRLTFKVDLHRVRTAERQMLRRCAVAIAVSGADARGLHALDGTKDPVVVPSSMTSPLVPADPLSADPVMLFVGSLDFPPNAEAIEMLLDDIVPRVRERSPEARLLVVGRRPSKAMRQSFVTRDWVEFLEDAPSVDDAYRRARCVVMPFKSGSGTKLKLYEALAYGLPVVTTQRGVAGIDVRIGQDVLVADEPANFVDLVAKVLEDDSTCRRLAASAKEAFDERLSWQRAAYPRMAELVERLTADAHGSSL